MTTIKMMTFNIRGALHDDGENAWPKRADLNLATLKKYDPDIIGFQELMTINRAFYAEHLTGYTNVEGLKTADQGERADHNDIYFKADRFDLLDSGRFYLSETPDVWSKSWDSSLVRAANWVILRDKTDGVALLHLNTHLDHVGEQARVEGSKMIVNRINALRAEKKLPVIVTADFNSRAWGMPKADFDKLPDVYRRDDIDETTPAGTVHGVFTGAGFVDTFYTGNTDHADTNTYHGFDGRDFPPMGLRIDWILTLDGAQTFTTEHCAIIRDEAPPQYPSDHYPVMATLALG